MRLFWQLMVFCTVLTWADSALSQRRPIADDTLGNERSIVTPQDDLGGLPGDRIGGGARRGDNLFHSFREFGIDAGRSVYFNDPGVRNILSRVTGGNVSEIFGRLGVLGNANLFLINPSGIVFGEGASLDVNGSFVGATADSFVFKNGFTFSATNPQAPSLLTVSVPIGLQYGRNSTSNIVNQGNLAVGRDLTLSASSLDLQGQLQAGRHLTLEAQNTLRVQDTVTHPFIAASNGQMLIQGNQIVDIFALNHPDSGFYSGEDMVLRSANTMGDAHFNAGGSFRIEQLDGRLGNLFSSYDPIVRARGDVSFESYTGASLHILAGGSVTIAGNITITEPDRTGNGLIETIQLSNGRAVAIDGTTQPTLDIRAGTTAVRISEIVGEEFSSIPETTRRGPRANITVGDTIRNPGGLVSLTNLYQPNLALAGGAITTQDIDTSTNISGNNGGAITINARDGILTGNLNSFSRFSSTTDTAALAGNGGAIDLYTANGNIRIGNAFAYSGFDPIIDPILETTISSSVSSNGGSISLLAANGNLTAGYLSSASVSAATTGDAITGAGGNISLSAVRDITVGTVGTSASSVSKARNGVTGSGGDISIYTANGDITASFLETSTRNSSTTGNATIGNAGNISLYTVDGDITINALESASQAAAESGSQPVNVFAGNGGDINIYTDNGNLAIGRISSSSVSFADALVNAVAGNAGNVRLYTANGDITVEGDSVIAGSVSTSITDDSVSGTTTSQNGGEIYLYTANGAITLGDSVDLISFSFAESGNSGRGGDVDVHATEDIATASINSSGQLGSGNIRISTQGDIFLREMVTYGPNFDSIESGAVITSDTFGAGTGGDIQITARSVLLSNGSQISASTHNSGQGGDVAVHASNSIRIGGIAPNNLPPGTIFYPGGLAGLPAGTFLGGYIPTGNADDIDVQNPPRNVRYPSGIFSQTTQNSTGNAGNVFIQTNNLTVRNGAAIATTTFGQGDAGDISINTSDGSVLADNGSILSGVAEGSFGNSGSIDIQTGSLSVSGGGLIQTQTLAQGRAGTIRIAAGQIEVSDRASIVVNSQGSGVAGDIDITAQSVQLDRGRLTAETQRDTVDGGNIKLQDLDLLLLRNGSNISTNAAGDGGNIGIDANFIVAVPTENSDISANAIGGNGGAVDITSEGVFGIDEQEANTNLSDITASSELGVQGDININTPNVDPSRGLVELPIALVDVSNQIAQSCPTNGDGELGSLVVTGRGGIPANPAEILGGETILTDLAEIEGTAAEGQENRGAKEEETDRASATTQAEIIEAQGWVVGADGKVILTVENSEDEPHRPAIAPILCPKS